MTEVFKAEGHVISFDLDNCKCRSTNQHVLSLTQSYLNNDVISRTVTGNWITTNWFTAASEYRMTISGAGMVWDTKYLAFDFVYGRTVEGKQIPFYTDVQAAVKAGTVYDVSTLKGFKN